jgi:hypothetical protein
MKDETSARLVSMIGKVYHYKILTFRIKENVKLDRTRGRKERMKKNGLGKV